MIKTKSTKYNSIIYESMIWKKRNKIRIMESVLIFCINTIDIVLFSHPTNWKEIHMKPKPRTIYMDDETYSHLRTLARRKKTSISAFVRIITNECGLDRWASNHQLYRLSTTHPTTHLSWMRDVTGVKANTIPCRFL